MLIDFMTELAELFLLAILVGGGGQGGGSPEEKGQEAGEERTGSGIFKVGWEVGVKGTGGRRFRPFLSPSTGWGLEGVPLCRIDDLLDLDFFCALLLFVIKIADINIPCGDVKMLLLRMTLYSDLN